MNSRYTKIQYIITEMERVMSFFFDNVAWQVGLAEHPDTRKICEELADKGILIQKNYMTFILHPRYVDIHRLYEWLDEELHIDDIISTLNHPFSLSMDEP